MAGVRFSFDSPFYNNVPYFTCIILIFRNTWIKHIRVHVKMGALVYSVMPVIDILKVPSVCVYSISSDTLASPLKCYLPLILLLCLSFSIQLS